MPRENVPLLAFNRGLISPLALARVDLKRTALCAETMTNWMPRVFGSMMLRPGLEYLGSSYADAAARFLPFVFSIGDTAALEFTDSNMRVWIDDELLTRGSVSSATTNGNFNSDVSGWTDADEAGAASVWVTGGYMGLTGNGTAAAIRRQQVSVGASDQNQEHALRIVINRGPVTLRVGSTSGGDEYINETALLTGTHSLAFTPTGSFWIQFESRLKRQVLVDSCNVESSGVVSITAPWAAADLDLIRGGQESQSGDVIFVACEGYQQRRIERRSTRSWSVVAYQSNDGPFRIPNTGPITITPSGLSGNITLTASAPLFRSGHSGALFRITSDGQRVTASVTAANQFTNAIRVTGVEAQRVFTIVITGTWVATVRLQRSLTSDSGPWEDVTSWTSNTTTTHDDGLDNQEAWYRIGVKTGEYTSGTVEVQLNYSVGSVDGIVRLTGVTNSTSASAEVITDLGGTDATDDWAEGEWSTYRGFPTAVALAEGRLVWSGKNGVWCSVSDAFDSFDDTTEGDSGPIARTIGSGPVDTINWVLALQRLILGGQGSEFVCKSSSIDEPLTPTNFNIKSISSQGSGDVGAIVIDKVGVYVQRGGSRVMQVGIDESGEYGSSDLTALVPEVTKPRVVRMAVQRQPDTRVHCVRSDGKVAILVFDKAENVNCWCLFETSGVVEDAIVLPGVTGDSEDSVYYLVRRTINGSTKRYFERWALEEDCEGGTLNEQADCFYRYSGSAVTTITGLSHLDGQSVVVWANGKSFGTFTVGSGQISGLSESVTGAIIGIAYTAQWKSTKLAYAAALGTALTQTKKISHLGVIMRNTYATGLKYGTSFDSDRLRDLPGTKDGADVSSTTVHSDYDEPAFEFEGEWDTDTRLCLQAEAPKPCNLLAAVISVETHDRY